MYVVRVDIHVLPEHAATFAAASITNARATRGEPGNVRFDVLRHETEASRFLFHEVYRSADDFAAHQQTAHYRAWRDAVAPWMAEPRVGTKYVNVDPPDAQW
jgi:autoinducer 2-degrading protein